MTAALSDPPAAASAEEFDRAEARTAHNYHPLPVVLAHAEGAWMTDVDGRRFLDLLAGYSALNFGHSHPLLVAAAHEQLDKLTLTSRAFVHDKFADFCAALGDLCGKELVLPMNTGAEAVETAIKVSRKWGYEVKGVPADQAQIIVASGNFHGRTTTIVGFSDDPDARDGFGPFTPGFVTVPYGDLAALEAAITATHRRRADRADPGRGRRGDPARRLPARRPRGSAPATTCCSPPTRSRPASAAPAAPSRATTRTSCPTSTSSARRSAAASSRSPPSWPTATCSACSSPASTARPSAATRSPARSATPWSSMLATGEFQRRAADLARHAAARAARGDDRPRRGRRTRARPVGRRRHRPGGRHRPRGLRGADGPRRTRQGHPRLHDPARPPAGHLRRRTSSGASTSWRPSSAADRDASP